MKYNFQFKNKHGNEFSVRSMEDYVVSEDDIREFTKVLDDEPVRKYITDEAKTKWGHPTTESLTKDILTNSALRWQQGAELRFLVRDAKGVACGMIGVTLKDKNEGELWYYKTSLAPSFMHEALVIVLSCFRAEGVNNLFATFDLDNIRSERILSNLGFSNTSKQGEMSIILSTPNEAKQ